MENGVLEVMILGHGEGGMWWLGVGGVAVNNHA